MIQNLFAAFERLPQKVIFKYDMQEGKQHSAKLSSPSPLPGRGVRPVGGAGALQRARLALGAPAGHPRTQGHQSIHHPLWHARRARGHLSSGEKA